MKRLAGYHRTKKNETREALTIVTAALQLYPVLQNGKQSSGILSFHIHTETQRPTSNASNYRTMQNISTFQVVFFDN
jgi:hypothetical protein